MRRPWFGDPELRIAGRNKTMLVAGLGRQVEVVRAAVEELAPGAPVRGCLCFVGGNATLPMFGGRSLGNAALLYPGPLAKRLRSGDELDAEARGALAAALAQRFRSA